MTSIEDAICNTIHDCVAPIDDYREETASAVITALANAGYKIVLRDPCRCGCDRSTDEHLCPCGCGHTYVDAVRKVMSGPMYLNWEQASSNIDEHPDVPCKWSSTT